jgi:hypothetical protein
MVTLVSYKVKKIGKVPFKHLDILVCNQHEVVFCVAVWFPPLL